MYLLCGVFPAAQARPSDCFVVSSGVGVITAPVNITAQFKEPLLAAGRVTIKFWETTQSGGQSSAQRLSFLMQRQGSGVSHMMGMISR